MNKQKFRGYLNETISIAGSALQEGQQTRDIMCPACNGGATKERSFAMLRERGAIKYRCWRSSCGFKGVLHSNAGILQEATSPVLVKEKTYYRSFTGVIERPVNGEGERFFEDQFDLLGLDLEQGEIGYAPDSNRYVFPCRGPAYSNRGVSLRTFEQNAPFPKWDHYPTNHEGPWCGWYIRAYVTHTPGPVVVVEDPISALKVSRQFLCCYLNGTSLNYEKMLEIMKVGRTKGVIFALDKDATSKAIDMLKEWSFYLGADARCVALEKDLKYSTNKEIREIFTGKG